MRSLLCVVLLAILTLGLAERKSYHGYQEWEVYLGHRSQVAVLEHLEATGQVDILLHPQPGRRGVVLVSPTIIRRTQTSLLTAGIRTRVLTSNFQQKIAKQYASLDARYKADPYAFDVDKFNTFDALMAQMDKWVAACPTGMQCILESIGNSYEGRPMKMLKFKKAGSSNKVLYFEFTIHAGEWLSPTAGQKMINKIITDYPSDAATKHLVDNYEIHVLLVANPDGYVYTMEPDSMWRKSRNNNTGSNCTGTDLNRNFNDLWGKQCGNTNPCSHIYQGSGPASEPEVKNMQAHIDSIKDRAVATFAVHDCGREWAFPYGYTKDFTDETACQRTVDHDDLQQVANAVKDAILEEHGVTWEAGTICEIIYSSTGSTTGYSYSKANIKYSWAIELDGCHPKNEDKIEPTFQQFWTALVAITNKIEDIEA